MSTPYTPGNVTSLVTNPAWEHIVKCLEAQLASAEGFLEQAGEFNHGKGIGIRQVAKMMLELPARMEKESQEGKPSILTRFREASKR